MITSENAQALAETAERKRLTSYHMSAILPIVGGRETISALDLTSLLRTLVQQSGLHAETDVSATFDVQGVSVVVVLKESHVAVHVWPELQLATVDIHVCDFSQDNRPKAEALAMLLSSEFSGDSSPASWTRNLLSR